MALKWKRTIGVVVRVYYRAVIVEGDDLPLYAYIANNGAGWWNACISPSDHDSMMEHPRRLDVAGSKTLAGAKLNVARALGKYARALRLLAGLDRPEEN